MYGGDALVPEGAPYPHNPYIQNKIHQTPKIYNNLPLYSPIYYYYLYLLNLYNSDGICVALYLLIRDCPREKKVIIMLVHNNMYQLSISYLEPSPKHYYSTNIHPLL